jgi:hypothetical protein
MSSDFIDNTSDSMFNISDFKLSGMGKYLLCSKDKE